jgi:SAM-dependent methyltransferase
MVLSVCFEVYFVSIILFTYFLVIGKFDAIIGSNLLCRLPDPKKFLHDVTSLLNDGGVLILISPYSWLDEYTTRDKWIGAVENGPDSFSVLKGILEDGKIPLELHHREDVAFIIREHERKYQLGVSDGTVWIKAHK